MDAKTRMRRSMARVEFLCCTESIEGMLQQGFSKQLIYEDLKEKGRISMAYVTFCKLIAKAMNSELAVPKDDPILMVVTICNAFLGEVQALHQRHEAGLTKLMADKTDTYQPVEKVRSGLFQGGLAKT